MHSVAVAVVVQSPLERLVACKHGRGGVCRFIGPHGYREWHSDAAFNLITRAVGTIGHFLGGEPEMRGAEVAATTFPANLRARFAYFRTKLGLPNNCLHLIRI